MKKIFPLLALFCIALFADVKYIDIFDAYDEAKKEHKIVMVMLSQEGCPSCEYMEDVVFNNTNIAETLERRFVVVHVDVYKDGVPDGLEFFATPTFYFLDSNEKVLKKFTGGQNAKDFADTLKAVKIKN